MRRVLLFTLLFLAAPAALALQNGDLLVVAAEPMAIGFTFWQLDVLQQNHQYVQGPGTGETRDIVTGTDGNLYLLGPHALVKQTPGGALIWSKIFAGPVAITIDRLGFVYVISDSGAVQKLDSAGNVIATDSLPGGAEAGDLSRDQCTLVYLDTSYNLRRYDLCVHAPIGSPSFPFPGIQFGSPLHVSATGDVFVKGNHVVYRLTPSGTVQSYAVSDSPYPAFAIDGNTLWAPSDTNLVQFDIFSGAVLNTIPIPRFGAYAFALEVYGPSRAAASLSTAVPTFSTLALALLALTFAAITILRFR